MPGARRGPPHKRAGAGPRLSRLLLSWQAERLPGRSGLADPVMGCRIAAVGARIQICETGCLWVGLLTDDLNSPDCLACAAARAIDSAFTRVPFPGINHHSSLFTCRFRQCHQFVTVLQGLRTARWAGAPVRQSRFVSSSKHSPWPGKAHTAIDTSLYVIRTRSAVRSRSAHITNRTVGTRRSASNSASFDAEERASSAIQQARRTNIRSSTRRVPEPAMGPAGRPLPQAHPQVSCLCPVWIPTGSRRWPINEISPGRVTRIKFSAPTPPRAMPSTL